MLLPSRLCSQTKTSFVLLRFMKILFGLAHRPTEDWGRAIFIDIVLAFCVQGKLSLMICMGCLSVGAKSELRVTGAISNPGTFQENLSEIWLGFQLSIKKRPLHDDYLLCPVHSHALSVCSHDAKPSMWDFYPGSMEIYLRVWQGLIICLSALTKWCKDLKHIIQRLKSRHERRDVYDYAEERRSDPCRTVNPC